MSAHLKSLARRLAPAQIPVFPLTGTVLLPGCELPLNIFEPRYLNMFDDALSGNRLIGMVQPGLAVGQTSEDAPNNFKPKLASVGTLGRIKHFSETDDGRYLVTLMGLKRFSIARDASVETPYRQAMVSYENFQSDPDVFSRSDVPLALSEDSEKRSKLITAMKIYAKSLGVQVDWDSLGNIDMPRLVDQSAMISPFEPADKQSLLEAQTPQLRHQLLIGLMTLYARPQKTPGGSQDSNDLQ